MATRVRTKDLGQVAGMLVSATPPTNTKILWLDSTVNSGNPIKYYNLSSNEWKTLGTWLV